MAHAHDEGGHDAHAGDAGKGGMADRGVTRPAHAHHAPPYSEERREAAEAHHRRTLWVPWTLVMLGAWTALAPWTLGYHPGTEAVAPSGGRDVYLDAGARVLAATASDVASGLLLVVLGWRALTPHRPVTWWLACGVGVWLTLAPVLLWSPAPAAYANDSLVGALVIALTILVPGMPAMPLFMRMGGDVPPGWSYNPSSWPQRWIMIALGFAGWMVSRVLAAYQLGFVPDVWEPFFGEGSRRVLDSDLSHAWPVSDAALGAVAFTFEFLMGFMGGTARWRTMPWMVAFFGVLVIPLGLVHVLLVISQPVVVGAWCTLCLLAAALMLPMIPLEVDEVLAMLQHVKRARAEGEPFWRVFWKGGTPEGTTQDERSTPLHEMPRQPRRVLASAVWGVSVPWTLVAAMALGAWLMAAPAVLGAEGAAAASDRLAGALVVTAAVVALAEPVRTGRFTVTLLGAWIALSHWVLPGGSTVTAAHASVTGLLIAALAVPRGPVRERYGAWTRAIR